MANNSFRIDGAQRFPSPSRSLNIPPEIIEEILTRLPVKPLLRFKCVSKLWRFLIESNHFKKAQFNNSRDDKTYANWRLFSETKTGLKIDSLKPSLDELSFVDPSQNNDLTTGDIVDSYNGVLCILKQPGRFFLWNPATRIFNELPKIDKEIVVCGFGWDEKSGAYKVFAVHEEDDDEKDGNDYKNVSQVYSSRTNSWKMVELDDKYNEYVYESGVFTSGKIHWLVENGKHIHTFDVSSEVFGTIDLPFRVDVVIWLCEINGCLCVCCANYKSNDVVDLWVMKEYDVKESWVKHVSVRTAEGSHYYVESLDSPFTHKNL